MATEQELQSKRETLVAKAQNLYAAIEEAIARRDAMNRDIASYESELGRVTGALSLLTELGHPTTVDEIRGDDSGDDPPDEVYSGDDPPDEVST